VLPFVDGYWFSLTNSRGRSIQSFQLPPEPREDPIFQPGEEKKKSSSLKTNKRGKTEIRLPNRLSFREENNNEKPEINFQWSP
jgi:hypothetical protein